MKYLAMMVFLGLVWGGCSDRSAQSEDGAVGTDASIDGGQGKEGGVGNDPAPKVIKGGGAGGGAVDGRLNMYVLDAATDAPLQGAFVMLGDGSKHQGSTDKDGLITFRVPGLKGPLSVTLAHKGYTTTTIEGANAANLTVRVNPRAGGATIKTGTCKGSIAGWAALPKLPANHLRVGLVHYLLDGNLGSPRNSVKQPKGSLNLYAPGPPLKKESWQVTVPAGSFGVFALVMDLDTKGTTTDKDDTMQLTHMGVKTGLTVQQGQTLSGVVVPVSPTSYTLKVTLPPKPAGTTTMGAAALVQLANKELASIFLPNASPGQVAVPRLEGDFKGGNFWVFLGADDGQENDDDARTNESLFIKRGITGVAQPVAASLLALPSGHASAAGGKVSFSSPAAATMVSLRVMPEKAGATYWEVVMLAPKAGLNSYALPTLPATVKGEAPPKGKLYLSVEVMELPGVDLNNARHSELFLKVSRLSRAGKVVTWQ